MKNMKNLLLSNFWRFLRALLTHRFVNVCSISNGLLRSLVIATTIVTLTAQAQITYFHNDVSGTPMMATDESGNVLWKENYRPYGDRVVNSPTATENNKLWFAGKPHDTNTGLSYMGARYYDPLLGRFVAVDPEGFNPNNVHSFNRYVYANNNPYRFVDPDGHSPLDIAFLAFDLGKLGVAMYTGVGVQGALVDVASSVVGVVSPIPGTGQAIKAARAADRGVDVIRAADRAVDITAVSTKVHGNTAGNQAATLYQKFDKNGEFLKHGITKHEDPAKRYTLKEIDGGTVVAIERGPRKEMLKKERELVETRPGKDNKEPWAGKRREEP